MFSRLKCFETIKSALQRRDKFLKDYPGYSVNDLNVLTILWQLQRMMGLTSIHAWKLTKLRRFLLSTTYAIGNADGDLNNPP